jgi:hypothetical protein
MILLADGTTATTTTTTITPSGSWSDPASWSSLVDKIGVGGFLFVFVCLLSAFLAWKWGTIIVQCLFGEKGYIQLFYARLDTFLGHVEENQTTLTKTMETHLNNCAQIHTSGGPCNVADLREAGHAAAEALRKIGQNQTCDVEAERIHAALRSQPMPSPIAQGQG